MATPGAPLDIDAGLDPRGPAVEAGIGRFACVAAAWERHGSELRSFLLRRIGDEQEAQDLLQDVFLKSMRQGADFCSLANPRAWLFRVARNALIDRLRVVHPSEPVSEDLPAASPRAEPFDALAGCIERVLPLLDAADEDVLRRCDLGGDRLQDFAIARGLTLAATKSRLQRARGRLREQLVATCRVRFGEQGEVCCHAGAVSRD